MQKGVFSINADSWELLNSPAFIGLIGFNCKPPLAPIIKITLARMRTSTALNIEENLNQVAASIKI